MNQYTPRSTKQRNSVAAIKVNLLPQRASLYYAWPLFLKRYSKEINKDCFAIFRSHPKSITRLQKASSRIGQTGPVLEYMHRFMTTLYNSPHPKGSEVKYLGNIFTEAEKYLSLKSEIAKSCHLFKMLLKGFRYAI